MNAQQTPLYDCHVAMNAQLVEFANTLLPVRYASEKDEHLAVRHDVGMFDVSHMGEFFIDGPDAIKFLQTVLTNNVEKLGVGQAHYSLMLNNDGGIIDDVIVYRRAESSFMLCVNAANIKTDWQWLVHQQPRFQITLNNASPHFAQIAVQGPRSAEMLSTLLNHLPERFCFIETTLFDYRAIIARTGYTGEDGFEIFILNEGAKILWQTLLDLKVKPCGLAARDSLRLEAGMLLHGTDMDSETSPLEARLGFAVDLSKSFIGKDALLLQKQTGLAKHLIGFRLLEKGIARHGFSIFAEDKTPMGRVTSGTWPPEQETAIGLAYCQKQLARGDTILIAIRDRFVKAVVSPTRFLKNKR